MISASVPDCEPVLKLLIQKGADVNQKSKFIIVIEVHTQQHIR